MNYVVTTYALYLTISIALTVWVARTLHKNGRLFLVDALSSQRLAHPLLLPLAFRACSLISGNRYKISKMLFDESTSNEVLRTRIAGMQIES